MRRDIMIRIRAQSWGLAAFFLIASCWVGFAVTRFASIFDGLQVHLPVLTKLVITAGPVAFPVFGIAAAVALLLTDGFSQARWMLWALIAVFALCAVCAFRAVLIGGVFMGPATQANERPALDAAIASSLLFGRHWRGTSEAGRSRKIVPV
jgi:hypothetical protein